MRLFNIGDEDALDIEEEALEGDFCSSGVLVAEPGHFKANVCEAIRAIGGDSVHAAQYGYIGLSGLEDDAAMQSISRSNDGITTL